MVTRTASTCAEVFIAPTTLNHGLSRSRNSTTPLVDLADAGRRVAESNLGRVRTQVGLVFQSPDDQLFSPTVFEDVAFGPIYQGLPEAEVRQRVDEALAAVQMSGFAWRVSHHLSVGEKKRIAIATVLSMRPGILVMDEPSAGPGPARPARTD